MKDKNTIYIGEDFIRALESDNPNIIENYLSIVENAEKNDRIMTCFNKQTRQIDRQKEFFTYAIIKALDSNAKKCLQSITDSFFRFNKGESLTENDASYISCFLDEDKTLYLFKIGLFDPKESYMRTTITHSMSFHNTDYLKALVKHKFIDLKEERFKGLLSTLVSSEFNVEYIKLLLDLGADVNEKMANLGNLTPLDIAKKNCNQEIVDCINQWVNEDSIKYRKEVKKEIRQNAFYINKIKRLNIKRIKGFNNGA